MGDSFTAGTGCAPGRSWADQLARHLAGGRPDFVYRNLAVEGASSGEVLDQLPAAVALSPDLVSVVCGANDVLFSVRPDAEAYARRLGAIFGVLRSAVPEVQLATATAPERWDFLEFGPRTRQRLERGLVAFNESTRSVAAEHGALCLEVAGHPGLGRAENFVADGLHPSAQGHDQAAAGFARLLELEVAA
jgi:lysophospholipase L1-like esterase